MDYKRLGAGLAALFLVIFLLVWTPYHYVILGLTVIALGSSAYFVFTWSWSIVRVKASEAVVLPWLGILDFVGLQMMVLIYTSLGLVNIVKAWDQISPPTSPTDYARRVILYLLVVIVTVLRSIRWIRFQRATGAPVAVRPGHDAFSDHHNALEGRPDERDSAERR